MHSDHLYCHDKRCCRKPIACLCLAMLLVIAGVLMSLHAINRKVEANRRATLAAVDGLRDQGIEHLSRLRMDIADDITAEVAAKVAASEKRSHELREKLADRLRLERKAGDDALRSDVAALAERTGNTFGDVGRDVGAVEAKIDKIDGLARKLVALEKLWLDHRCPEPCKCRHTSYPDRPIGPPVLPAPAKVLPPGCPPNMYTIPYAGSYGR